MHQHLNTLYQGQSLTRDAARVVPLTVDRALVTAFDRSLRRPDSAWTASADALGRARDDHLL